MHNPERQKAQLSLSLCSIWSSEWDSNPPPHPYQGRVLSQLNYRSNVHQGDRRGSNPRKLVHSQSSEATRVRSPKGPRPSPLNGRERGAWALQVGPVGVEPTTNRLKVGYATVASRTQRKSVWAFQTIFKTVKPRSFSGTHQPGGEKAFHVFCAGDPIHDLRGSFVPGYLSVEHVGFEPTTSSVRGMRSTK